MWNLTAMIQGVSRLKEAMECGKEVADPAGWKNIAVTTNKIATVLSFVCVVLKAVGVEFPLDDKALVILAGGVAGLLSFANIVITLITSKKVGV